MRTIDWFLMVVPMLAVGRVPHNMDKLLHRGIYAVESEGGAIKPKKENWFSPSRLIGIDEHFTRPDRWVAYGVFCWTMSWFLVFLLGSLAYLLHPFPSEFWANYWRFAQIMLPLVIAFITTIWFTIGCYGDLRRFFRRLTEEQVDSHDDGSVAPAVASGKLKIIETSPLSVAE